MLFLPISAAQFPAKNIHVYKNIFMKACFVEMLFFQRQVFGLIILEPDPGRKILLLFSPAEFVDSFPFCLFPVSLASHFPAVHLADGHST